MNNAKPFYLSLTIVGALVHLFITLTSIFGVDLNDQAGAITNVITQCTLAGGAFLATFSTIVGRIRARKTISLGSAPLKMFLVLTAVTALSLTACATQSTTTTAVESYAAEAAGVAATTATVELVGGKTGGPTKAAIATDFLTVANAGYTIVASGNLTTAQIDSIFQSFKSDENTTAFDTIAEDVAQQLDLYLQANPNANAQEVVTSFFQGVQLAASALGGVAPTATGTSAAGPAAATTN
ncbi:MAG: hypothetical protein LV481_16010 [Methylacidiphilales bacterium]|nr:hypothetical protein [Candidatus Methylacidiphilales bacterium]